RDLLVGERVAIRPERGAVYRQQRGVFFDPLHREARNQVALAKLIGCRVLERGLGLLDRQLIGRIVRVGHGRPLGFVQRLLGGCNPGLCDPVGRVCLSELALFQLVGRELLVRKRVPVRVQPELAVGQRQLGGIGRLGGVQLRIGLVNLRLRFLRLCRVGLGRAFGRVVLLRIRRVLLGLPEPILIPQRPDAKPLLDSGHKQPSQRVADLLQQPDLPVVLRRSLGAQRVLGLLGGLHPWRYRWRRRWLRTHLGRGNRGKRPNWCGGRGQCWRGRGRGRNAGRTQRPSRGRWLWRNTGKVIGAQLGSRGRDGWRPRRLLVGREAGQQREQRAQLKWVRCHRQPFAKLPPRDLPRDAPKLLPSWFQNVLLAASLYSPNACNACPLLVPNRPCSPAMPLLTLSAVMRLASFESACWPLLTA